MYLPTLSDDEQLTYAEQTIDPLTTSDLERELIKRLRSRDTERLDLLDARDIDTAAGLEAFFDEIDAIKEKVESL